MSRNPKTLTIHHAQAHQPWTVPYSEGVLHASESGVPHILSTHDVLHAMKSLGKLATVFERLDHAEGGKIPPDEAYQAKVTVRAMAADLVTAALRLGNLWDFSVAEALVERVKDKNDVNIIEWPTQADAKDLAGAAVVAMRNAAAGGFQVKAQGECTCGSLSGIPDVARRAGAGAIERSFNGHKVGDWVQDRTLGIIGRVESFNDDGGAMVEEGGGKLRFTNLGFCEKFPRPNEAQQADDVARDKAEGAYDPALLTPPEPRKMVGPDRFDGGVPGNVNGPMNNPFDHGTTASRLAESGALTEAQREAILEGCPSGWRDPRFEEKPCQELHGFIQPIVSAVKTADGTEHRVEDYRAVEGDEHTAYDAQDGFANPIQSGRTDRT